MTLRINAARQHRTKDEIDIQLEFQKSMVDQLAKEEPMLPETGILITHILEILNNQRLATKTIIDDKVQFQDILDSIRASMYVINQVAKNSRSFLI